MNPYEDATHEDATPNLRTSPGSASATAYHWQTKPREKRRETTKNTWQESTGNAVTQRPELVDLGLYTGKRDQLYLSQ
jgi:alpha-L-arabinofuranosidase